MRIGVAAQRLSSAASESSPLRRSRTHRSFVSGNDTLAGAVENSNFFRKAGAEHVSLLLEIESSLEVEPEPLARPEVTGEPQCRIGAHRSLAVHDLVDAARRYRNVLREAVLRDAEWLEEVGVQHFARVDGRQFSRGHVVSSVVVDDRDVMRVAIPPDEAHPPLVVDTDAVLAGAVAAQLLQTITRWDAEVIECFRRVDRDELAEHDPAQLCRVPPNGIAGKEAFGVAVAEALDHRSMLTQRVTNVKR